MTNDDTCTCYPVPEHLHTTHYGATDPASTLEPNPECPAHFPAVMFATFGTPPPRTLADFQESAVRTVSVKVGDVLEVATIDAWPLRDEVAHRAGQQGTFRGPQYVAARDGYPELGVVLQFDDGDTVAFLPNELVLPRDAS